MRTSPMQGGMLQAKKRFGQNFLIDRNIIAQMIATIAPKADQQLLEIGPGRGALTNHLAKIVPDMHAVELDRDLIEELTKLNINLYNQDILKFEFNKFKNLRIVGNIPYNISSPLIFHLIDNLDYIHDIYLLLQKELAMRLCAEPKNKSYGRITVMVQYYCEITDLFDVPGEAFRPIPKVTSTFVKITPRRNLPECNLAKLQAISTAAFNQRRKTLQNSLKSYFGRDELLKAGIDPQVRAEQLSVAEFVRLSNL